MKKSCNNCIHWCVCIYVRMDVPPIKNYPKTSGKIFDIIGENCKEYRRNRK